MSLPPRLRSALARLRPAAGYVDRFDTERVAGWAVDPGDPGRPARLSLHIDGVAVMNIAATLPRADVSATGRAPLHCGFDAPLPGRLRDGAAHRVEIRLGERGRMLRGGRLDIVGRAGAVPTMAPAETEAGVVWFDRPRGALVGWASGVTAVVVDFGAGAPADVLLDREVPGFGAGTRPGFAVPVPAALADGAEHTARIFAGETELDGSPVRFRLAADRPRIRVEARCGGRVSLGLRDAAGAPDDRPVRAEADGAPLELRRAGPGRIELDLPEAARHLVLLAGPPRGAAATPEGTLLARYVIAPGRGLEDWSRQIAPPVLDAARLPDDLCAAAAEAFAAFAAGPDTRFDAPWVAAEAGLDDPGAALAHWRDTGARDGLSPGPGFDEAAARALHPAVAAAVAEDRLPCAFALDLVLGAGALGDLTGLAAPIGGGADPASALPPETPAAPAPAAAELPPPTALRAATESIYAAWLARLDAPPEAMGEIAADETALRRDIAAVGLHRRPLVSIVMPSWNRAFTIGEAIQSVLEQSYADWELLVCDDASEDRTADVVRGFADPRIRYMRFLKSNGAGARNHGLRFARGEFIAYLDSDNLWHPLFLERMLRELLEHPGQPIAYASYLDTETVGARVALREIARPAFRPVQLSHKNFMDLNSIVHHRRVTDWMGGFDPALERLQDWDMVLRHTSVFGARHVDRLGVFYRRNIAWGQVTHTQLASGAQDRVNEKTAARLAGAHARLAPDWPARPRLTLLTGGTAAPRGAGLRLLGERLAGIAAEIADVTLVSLGEAPEGVTPAAAPGLARIALPAALAADPARLGHALGGLLGAAPVIGAGLPPGLLRALPGLAPGRALELATSGEMSALVDLAEPRLAFPLGALPLDLPASGGAAPDDRPELLFLSPATAGDWAAAQDRQALRVAAATHEVALILPPAGAAPWRRIDGSGTTPLEAAPLPAALARLAAAVVAGPLSGLDPVDTALMHAAQGAGVPLAVADDAATPPGSFARQWVDARAAYALKSPDPDWIFEKLAKLRADHGAMARLAERSRTVHAIAFHPALLRERLAHALWRMSVAPPRIEVSR